MKQPHHPSPLTDNSELQGTEKRGKKITPKKAASEH